MPHSLVLPFAPPVGERFADPDDDQRPAPTRVIEVGAVTAGIAVPESRGVRFFSSSRAFDRLDGTVFGSAEQAARAARAHARPAARRLGAA